MNFINNLKVSAKLTLAFGIILAILIGVAVLGYHGISSVNAGMRSMYFDRTLPIQQIGFADAALFKLRGDVYKYYLAREGREAIRKDIEADKAVIKENFDKYRATFLVDEEKAALAEFDQVYAAYLTAVEKALTDIDNGREQEALTSILDGGEVSNARKAVGAAMEKLIEINVQVAAQLQQDGDK